MNAPMAVGVPVPCTNCGATMVARGGEFLHQAPRFECPYCARVEVLPAEATEQHRHLRLRLLQLKHARDMAEAPLRTFKAVSKTLPLMAAFGLYQSGSGVAQFLKIAKRLHSVSQSVDEGSVTSVVVPVGLFAGMLIGWLAMVFTYRSKVRPLLRARPPMQQGLTARCRCCGAPLPPVRAPEVACAHCAVVNLLDAALTRDASALLANEADEHYQRARGWTQDASVYGAPARALRIFGIGGGVATALLVGAGLLAALPR